MRVSVNNLAHVLSPKVKTKPEMLADISLVRLESYLKHHSVNNTTSGYPYYEEVDGQRKKEING